MSKIMRQLEAEARAAREKAAGIKKCTECGVPVHLHEDHSPGCAFAPKPVKPSRHDAYAQAYDWLKEKAVKTAEPDHDPYAHFDTWYKALHKLKPRDAHPSNTPPESITLTYAVVIDNLGNRHKMHFTPVTLGKGDSVRITCEFTNV